MENTTKFLLDSGDPQEYREIAKLASEQGSELWGSTTNPSLIAQSASRRIAGKKISQEEAFKLQKEIVLEITTIVPGAVSAEVYSDEKTSAKEMIEQGREIATWHKHVIVKLPTTFEGFKARTVLRQEKIPVNNTLVFSQEQIFAICLHEQIIQKLYGPTTELWPPFISPFVGRLDDQRIDGMYLVENGIKIKKEFSTSLPMTHLAMWMLEASVRKIEHIKRGIVAKTELITAPAKLYREWFALSPEQQTNVNADAYAHKLDPIEYLTARQGLRTIASIEEFMDALSSKKLDIYHPLTEKGLTRFAEDWKAIIT